jgi:hypothetical protein
MVNNTSIMCADTICTNGQTRCGGIRPVLSGSFLRPLSKESVRPKSYWGRVKVCGWDANVVGLGSSYGGFEVPSSASTLVL